MTKSFILCILFFCTARICSGQVELKGIIKDQGSHPIANAAIRLLNSNHISFSDTLGVFIFKGMTEGYYRMHASAPGFAASYRNISIDTNTTSIEIVLVPILNQLENVVVSSQKREEMLQELPMSIHSFSSQDIDNYRFWNVHELSAVVPNMYVAHPGDNRMSVPSVALSIHLMTRPWLLMLTG